MVKPIIALGVSALVCLTVACSAAENPVTNADAQQTTAPEDHVQTPETNSETERDTKPSDLPAIQPATLADFKRAAIEHARFQSCFKSKLSSGYCHISESATDLVEGLADHELESLIADRLAGLSSTDRETAALIYHEARDGSLGIYLFDKSGLQSAGIRPSAEISIAMDGLKRTLSVDTRARTIRGDMPAPLSAEKFSMSSMSELLIPGTTAAKIEQGQYARLLILPSRTTAIVPFPALTLSGDRQLVDQVSVVFLPDLDSLTLPINPDFGDARQHFEALSFDSRSARERVKLVVGDPDYAAYRGFVPSPLPGARREAMSVSGMMNADETLIGDQATHQAVVSSISSNEQEIGMIYFATHGLSDAENPMDGSLLALSGRHLFAQEIKSFDFRQSHPLVVLSACQTGLGKQFEGGTFGLLRAWYGAGAGQVVGSLWNVDDAGTRHLMTGFVEQLTDASISPEEALRIAMLKTRESYSNDPAIWSSFYVFGNPALN